MRQPYLLFDFDGTIANSIDLLYQMINLMAPKYGLEQISLEDFNVIRNMPLAAVLRMIEIPWYKLPGIISKSLHEYKKRIHELHPYAGIPEMLYELRRSGYGVALLSSNSRQNVVDFLDRHRLHYFDWIEGTSGVLKKQDRIRKQIKKHKLDVQELIYVGDESRDIQAAKACGIKVISVTWGLHPQRLLLRYNPDYIVDTPSQITDIVKGLCC